MIYAGIAVLIIGLLLEALTVGLIGHVFVVIGCVLILVGIVLLLVNRTGPGPGSGPGPGRPVV
jgi:hypothetical protein